MNDTVLLERQGSIALLTLNRPAALNALDYAMIEALVARTADAAADDAIRVVVLRGAGKHFMVGGDLRAFAQSLPLASPDRQAHFQRTVEFTHAAVEALYRMPQPLICSVQGAVAGIGLSLMNACDLVVAAEDAYFNSAYRHVALSPDGGGSYALPRLVGLRKAMEIMLLSERFDVREAQALGLVNRVVATDELTSATMAIAESLAKGPVVALRNAKRLLRQSFDRALSEQLQDEAVSFGQCAGLDDFAEGINAFLEKRPARFGR